MQLAPKKGKVQAASAPFQLGINGLIDYSPVARSSTIAPDFAPAAGAEQLHLPNNNRFEIEPGGKAPRIVENVTSPEQRQLLRELAHQIRFSRDIRGKLFNQSIFGEPAWDILLVLYTIDNDRRRLSTRELSRLAGLALTTALRWLDYLEEQNLVARRSNPFDLRMVYAELSDKGRANMDNYLLQMRSANMLGPTTNISE